MKIIKTKISGPIIIEPRVFNDSRGYFFEPYNKKIFDQKIEKINFVQDNESESSFGVFRGFHFQKPPHEQAKLVRCIKGEIIDFALDIRKNSPTFGKFEKITLSDRNKKQFFIPRGFAHAFLVVSNIALVSYKVDNYYEPESESGVFWDDPNLKIDWGIEKNELIISEKDRNLELLFKIKTST